MNVMVGGKWICMCLCMLTHDVGIIKYQQMQSNHARKEDPAIQVVKG